MTKFTRGRCLHLPLFLSVAASLASAAEVRLIDAIKDQNHKVIQQLIASHADVNATLPDGSTPLAWAAYQDDAETVAALLKAGAKVSTVDQYGETPLTLACANGDAAVVESFLKADADPNAARWSGETALMIAAGSGNPKVVQMLIDKGAKVDAVESVKGQNALMWGAANGHTAAIEELLKAGANPNTASKSGFTPLIFSAERGDTKSASSLIAGGANVNYQLPDGNNPLLVAVTAKKAEVASLFVEKGASVASKDRTGNTPLHIAAQLGATDLVKSLIAKGADVNAKTNETAAAGRGRGGGFFRGPAGQQTPLMLAARGDHVGVMKALVAAGADPKARAQDGSTVLMAAANSGHVDAVEYAYQLDPDSIKAATNTKAEVMHAAVTGSMQTSTQPEICKVVQFLADKGATLDPVDQNGRTPIIIADVLPIDMAVELLTKLITATGAKPHVATKR